MFVHRYKKRRSDPDQNSSPHHQPHLTYIVFPNKNSETPKFHRTPRQDYWTIVQQQFNIPYNLNSERNIYKNSKPKLLGSVTSLKRIPLIRSTQFPWFLLWWPVTGDIEINQCQCMRATVATSANRTWPHQYIRTGTAASTRKPRNVFDNVQNHSLQSYLLNSFFNTRRLRIIRLSQETLSP